MLAVLALTLALAPIVRSQPAGLDGRLHAGSVRVAAAGLEIAYLSGGAGSPVLLLHGHPQTALPGGGFFPGCSIATGW